MKRILGIDMGEKRIGLAVSDPLGITAQGLETLPNEGPKKVLSALARIAKEYEVGEAVVGLPMNMNGTTGPKAQEVLQWVPELERALGIPVATWDERLTSRQAGRAMTEGGVSGQKQRQNADRLAAILILQGYLESKRPRSI